MNAYKDLLHLVLTEGKRKKNRTGVDTFGVFGAQARFNLQNGFPLLTTKKMFTKAIVHELLWFIKGDTNIKYLVDSGVNIWNKDAYRRYSNTPIYELPAGHYKRVSGDPTNIHGEIVRSFTLEEFIENIKNSDLDEPIESFSKKWGDLGEGTYGGMWRAFPFDLDCGSDFAESADVDQLTKVLNTLKTNPDDRRMIVSAWHPYWVDHCVLPPCHVLFQFHTEELELEERVQIYGGWDKGYSVTHADLNEWKIPSRRLNLQMYQRSCDLFLGVPFNIASYALLLSMVAQVSNMIPGEFIHTYGDLHLYENHIAPAKEQMAREPRPLPKLVLNDKVTSLFDFKYEDITFENYDPHPTIKAELSV